MKNLRDSIASFSKWIFEWGKSSCARNGEFGLPLESSLLIESNSNSTLFFLLVCSLISCWSCDNSATFCRGRKGGGDEGNSIVFPSCVENVCDISRIMRFGLGFELVFCEASKLFPYCPSSALSPSLSHSLYLSLSFCLCLSLVLSRSVLFFACPLTLHLSPLCAISTAD